MPAPRRLPELHDVPYDTPPSSSSNSGVVEETEAIYENTTSKKAAAETGASCQLVR